MSCRKSDSIFADVVSTKTCGRPHVGPYVNQWVVWPVRHSDTSTAFRSIIQTRVLTTIYHFVPWIIRPLVFAHWRTDGRVELRKTCNKDNVVAADGIIRIRKALRTGSYNRRTSQPKWRWSTLPPLPLPTLSGCWGGRYRLQSTTICFS